MPAFIFFYNLLLTLVFVILALSYLLLYQRERRPIYLWIGAMFGSFFADNLVLYMKELLPGFTSYYTATTVHHYLGSLIGMLILFSYRRVLLADGDQVPSRREYLLWACAIALAVLLCVPALGLSLKYPSVLSGLVSFLVFFLALRGRLRNPQHPYLIPTRVVAIALGLQMLEALERLIDGFGLDSLVPNRYLSVELVSLFFSGLAIWHLISKFPSPSDTPQPKAADPFPMLPAFSQQMGLTPREREVLELLAQGMSNKEIGDKLFISEGTVKTHIHNIYQKAGISNRFQLIKVLSDFTSD